MRLQEIGKAYMISLRVVINRCLLCRFDFLQQRLPKKSRKKTHTAQHHQLLDVLFVACGLRHACLPDRVVLSTEDWQWVLESLQQVYSMLAMSLMRLT